MEEFRIIKDYPDYEVSNFGNVRKGDKILKPSISNGYKVVSIKRKSVKVHRLVGKEFIANPNNKPFIDHINNVITDNRVENLRWATNQENQFNSKLPLRNKSGIKGVRWIDKLKKWKASIVHNNINIYLGYFGTKEEASEARRTKAIELFGEFINKVELVDDLDELDREFRLLL